MSRLQIICHFEIHNGKVEEFKNTVAQCITTVKEKDTATLQYDWYFNENETECVLIEAYPDSDALLAHLGNLGDLFAGLLASCNFFAEVFGKPSQTVLDVTAGLNRKFYSFYKGALPSPSLTGGTDLVDKGIKDHTC